MAVASKSRSFLIFSVICVSILFPMFRGVSSAPGSGSDSDSDSDSDLVAELVNLQSRSESRVIRLDDHSVKRFLAASKRPRPYSIILFFDAEHVHSKAELHLQDLLSEFRILASSFVSNNKDSPFASKLFFCEIEFKESQSTFARFGVNSLPHIRLVEPHVNILKDSEQVNPGDFSRLAEGMADFVESRTKLSVGPIRRPPMFTNRQFAFLGAAVLVCLPFIGKKILSGETLLHDPKVWLAFAVFVYFFSVSGAMHSIIRKMPLFLPDRNNPSSLIFFYQGSGMQLGAEGFVVGFLYTIVGLLLALTTHLLVKVNSVNAQRVLMILTLWVSFWAVKKVVYLDNWKTGYGIHAYWPSSWN